MIKEAQLDDSFNVQLRKVQDAVARLEGIIEKMTAEGSTTKPTATQRMALRYLADDFKKLHEKSQ